MILEVVIAAAAGVAGGFFAGRRRRELLARPNGPGDGIVAAAGDSQFDVLLRSLTVGVVTLDERGYVRSLNAAAVAIFGFGSRPVVGRAIIEVIPSFELDRRVSEALAGQPSRGRLSLAKPNGTRVLTVATLPLDGTGGVLVIASDETRLHELEETRRDFVSNVSHELRTPLSSISLMIETIVKQQPHMPVLFGHDPLVVRRVKRADQVEAVGCVCRYVDKAIGLWTRFLVAADHVEVDHGACRGEWPQGVSRHPVAAEQTTLFRGKHHKQQ